MDHSVSAYLARQSADALISFLEHCCQDNAFSQYYYVIPDILDELSVHSVEIPPYILTQWLQFREQCEAIY